MLRPEGYVDGIHDLGGMQGFGPVIREQNEPVFHAEWEGAVFAMMRAARARKIFNSDEMRHAIERMDPAEYLASSYYERWLAALTRLLAEKGVVTEAETGARPANRARRRAPAAGESQAVVLDRYSTAQSSFRSSNAAPAFAVGQTVVTSNERKPGHTRLPRYARGKRGVIAAQRGTHVFPDASAHGLGDAPQPLYSVRFEAAELWGTGDVDTAAPVYLDLWESYLATVAGPGGDRG